MDELSSLQNFLQSFDLHAFLMTVFSAAAALFCLTVHELSHGAVAYALGDPTAKDEGRLTLNPIKHIDPLGLVLMITAHVGWAKPVPVDPRYFKDPKRGMALTALAGPVSNLLLAALAIGISKVIYLSGYYHPALNAVFLFCLYTLAPLSVGLGLFNLVPIPPLDGAKVLGALLPDEAYFRIMRYERYGMLALILLSFTGAGSAVISRGIMAVYGGLFNLFY